jgi:hypothetical protein
MARDVGPEIRAMAMQLGYLPAARLNRTRRRIDNLQKIPHRFVLLCFGVLGGILLN